MNRIQNQNVTCQVMIVDDDETERNLLVELLTTPHRMVTGFASAATAMEFLRDHQVDLALVDHVMPGMKGGELAQHIKALSPTTRVVMCTGYLVEVGHPQISKYADQVFHKPLRLGNILEVADSIHRTEGSFPHNSVSVALA